MDAQNILSMMATNDKALMGSKPEDVPGREEFSDFSVVLQNGQEVKCHKITIRDSLGLGIVPTLSRQANGHDSVGGLGALMPRIIPTVAIRALFRA